jgi:hypothetical protein
MQHHLSTMVLIQVLAANFLHLGLKLIGFDQGCQNKTCAATNLRHFKAKYVASPETCANIFSNLQNTKIEAARINKPNTIYFFMMMNWLEVWYKVKEELAGTFKVVKKTTQKWIWEFAHKIQALKADKKVSTYNNSQLLCL